MSDGKGGPHVDLIQMDQAQIDELARHGVVKKQHSHYYKDVTGLDFVDVYRVLALFNVTDPCIQHAVKKLLVAGGRGAGKDVSKDIQESIDCLLRWKEMRKEEAPPLITWTPAMDQRTAPLAQYGGTPFADQLAGRFPRPVMGQQRCVQAETELEFLVTYNNPDPHEDPEVVNGAIRTKLRLEGTMVVRATNAKVACEMAKTKAKEMGHDLKLEHFDAQLIDVPEVNSGSKAPVREFLYEEGGKEFRITLYTDGITVSMGRKKNLESQREMRLPWFITYRLDKWLGELLK